MLETDDLLHLNSILVRVTIVIVKHHDQKQVGEHSFALHFHIIVHHRRKSGQELRQGRNLKAEGDAETLEECCLLSTEPRTISPGMAPPTVVWALPHQ